MRILVVGASGTIGSAVASTLEGAGHDIVTANYSSGDLTVDLSDPDSVRAVYARAGALDAVVCAAGIAVFGQLEELDDEAFETSIANKLMGQANLVRFGVDRVAPGGSFTLTTGGLSQEPAVGTSAVSMVGAGVEAFARGVALDLAGRYRVNVISPGYVAETRLQRGLPAMPGVWAADLARVYLDVVEGTETGQVINVWE